MRTPLGQRLRHIRASLTQPEMAESLGIAQRTYASYERDERTPDAALLALLADNGWNANWILTGEGPERLASAEHPKLIEGKVEEPRSAYVSAVHPGRLRSAIRLVELALQMASREMAAGDKAELIADLYCWLQDHGDALTPDNLVEIQERLGNKIGR